MDGKTHGQAFETGFIKLTLLKTCPKMLKTSRTRYQALGPELILVYRQKFHRDCSSRSRDIVVTRSVWTNEQMNKQTDRPKI